MSDNLKQVGSVVKFGGASGGLIYKVVYSGEYIVIKKINDDNDKISEEQELSFHKSSHLGKTMQDASKEWEEYQLQKDFSIQSVSVIENLLDGVKRGRIVIKEVRQDQEDYFGIGRDYKISFSYSVLEKIK